MASLAERAKQLPLPKTGGTACLLGSAVAALPEPLRSEAAVLILDRDIPTGQVVGILAEPDVGVFTDIAYINKHRRGECKWCHRNGVME